MRTLCIDMKLSVSLYSKNDKKHIGFLWAQCNFFSNITCFIYADRCAWNSCLLLQGVSKILGKISGLISPHEKREENSHHYASSDFGFRGTALAFAQPQSFRFLYMGAIKTLLYWALIAGEGHQHIFIRINPLATGAVPMNCCDIPWLYVCACINSGEGYAEHLVWIITW